MIHHKAYCALMVPGAQLHDYDCTCRAARRAQLGPRKGRPVSQVAMVQRLEDALRAEVKSLRQSAIEAAATGQLNPKAVLAACKRLGEVVEDYRNEFVDSDRQEELRL